MDAVCRHCNISHCYAAPLSVDKDNSLTLNRLLTYTLVALDNDPIRARRFIVQMFITRKKHLAHVLPPRLPLRTVHFIQRCSVACAYPEVNSEMTGAYECAVCAATGVVIMAVRRMAAILAVSTATVMMADALDNGTPCTSSSLLASCVWAHAAFG